MSNTEKVEIQIRKGGRKTQGTPLHEPEKCPVFLGNTERRLFLIKDNLGDLGDDAREWVVGLSLGHDAEDVWVSRLVDDSAVMELRGEFFSRLIDDLAFTEFVRHHYSCRDVRLESDIKGGMTQVFQKFLGVVDTEI